MVLGNKRYSQIGYLLNINRVTVLNTYNLLLVVKIRHQ